MIVGLTGGIACGKSTVSAMLAQRGAEIVDADQVAREVVLPGEPALAQITELFGQAILNEDGTMNRGELGRLVFGNREKLDQLEGILHPAIRSRMWERMNASEQKNPGGLIVADIPLLYETGQALLYKKVIVVYIPRELQAERLMARNGFTMEQAEQRISLQMDIEEKKKHADYVIDNSGSLENTETQIEQLWLELGLSGC
ncbi:dephospho-CoA kinase [Paenibacillus nasutitermitis]|uniref:Dephospho-CoA kinase n=1 Tax=Paenibacillus nasutitermitis TaxID=1652958 RepID=A0A916YM86_9BACL|nr:dephospho-CoA kinase [Paenibacillus nasutitermitis]GGD52753.1 dephospho-CoA kinase [Paenibacillus nasutitermitis]